MDWLNIMETVDILGESVLHVTFTARFTKKSPKLWHYLAYLAALRVIYWLSTALAVSQLAVVWELLPLYAIARFALHNRRLDSCITALLAVYMAQLSLGIVYSLETLVIPLTLGNNRLVCLAILLSTLTALALCAFCYALVQRWFPLTERHREVYAWLLLPPGLFLLAAELYILITAYGTTISYRPKTGAHLALLTLQILSLSTLLCSLYACQRICRNFQAQAAYASLAQETQAQKTYVAEAQMRYEKTRSFRHDIQNHLAVLNGLLKSGQTPQAKKYLQKLSAAADALSFPCHTGCPAVDILLGEKMGLAKSQGIRTELSLVLPRPWNVDDLDLCIIFANALDNALAACTPVRGGEFIRAEGRRQGDFYLLTFENTCHAPPSLKAGTGISNIRTVAEKYNGIAEIDASGNVFRLHVLLNIPSGGGAPVTPS